MERTYYARTRSGAVVRFTTWTLRQRFLQSHRGTRALDARPVRRSVRVKHTIWRRV